MNSSCFFMFYFMVWSVLFNFLFQISFKGKCSVTYGIWLNSTMNSFTEHTWFDFCWIMKFDWIDHVSMSSGSDVWFGGGSLSWHIQIHSCSLHEIWQNVLFGIITCKIVRKRTQMSPPANFTLVYTSMYLKNKGILYM